MQDAGGEGQEEEKQEREEEARSWGGPESILRGTQLSLSQKKKKKMEMENPYSSTYTKQIRHLNRQRR